MGWRTMIEVSNPLPNTFKQYLAIRVMASYPPEERTSQKQMEVTDTVGRVLSHMSMDLYRGTPQYTEECTRCAVMEEQVSAVTERIEKITTMIAMDIYRNKRSLVGSIHQGDWERSLEKNTLTLKHLQLSLAEISDRQDEHVYWHSKMWEDDEEDEED